MKRIGIITFHFVNNFGGTLQAYALQRVIAEQCNAQVLLVDYRNWFIRLTDRIRLFPISTNPKEILSGLASMGQRISRRNKFGHFTKDNCTLTRKYANHFQLAKHPPQVDKYVCGSDQIWNPFLTMGVSPCYFLAFEKEPKNKIAYAPSFGTDRVARLRTDKMSRYINDIGYLSVREKSGQELIKKLTGRDALRLIDPTFLLSREQWEALPPPRAASQPYILLYIMQRDETVYEYARKLKEDTGLKLIEISRYGYQPGFVDEILIDVGPTEFLGLFRDAAYICTNSYHGLAYSIIFEKEFCLIPSKHFTARINNMLDMFHIAPVVEGQERPLLTSDYDRAFVRQTIAKEREKAIQYLVESIGDPA